MSIHLRRLETRKVPSHPPVPPPKPPTSADGPSATVSIDRAIAALYDAFKDQPIDRAFNGYDDALADANWRSSILAALSPEAGAVWVAGKEVGEVDAVCIAYGPGRWYAKSEAERTIREEMFESKLSEKGKRWIEDDFVGTLNALLQRCYGPSFDARDRAAWHISILGTRTAMQGRGLGSALVRRVFEMGDADGAETIVITTSIENVRYYERLGFVSGGEPATVPIEGGESGLWCLTRRPATDSNPG